MNRKNNIYQEQLLLAIKDNDFSNLYNNTIMITGVTGLIGSCLVDMLMKENINNEANITIIGLVRNIENAKKLFKDYLESKSFKLVKYDILEEFKENIEKVDYIIHAASNAHPIAFSKEPVETLLGNINGTKNMLEIAKKYKSKRFLFVSSGEIYGENVGCDNGFYENYRGYIDNLSARACYPIGKISAETMCICYAREYNLNTVIVRPCHIYGPTITNKDSRVIAQFIRNVLNDEDIVMKSEGKQYRSYCYVVDCVTAILTALIKGENENAYNIANKDSNITIREMAEIIAKSANKKVVFDLPSEMEKAGYTVVQKSILVANKLEGIGWVPKYNINEGIESTIKILKN